MLRERDHHGHKSQLALQNVSSHVRVARMATSASATACTLV